MSYGLLCDLLYVPLPGENVDLAATWDGAKKLGVARGDLAACEQNPEYHGEGDVAVHTEMAVQALCNDEAWQELESDARAEVFCTVLLHDVAKPQCTKIEEGRIRQPGHAHRGEKVARELLWRAGVAPDVRERVAQAIRYHLHPFYLLEKADPVRNLLTIAEVVAPRRLAMISRADALGRICDDQGETLAGIGLFEDQARELGCLDGPYPFASGRSRFEYFLTEGRDPAYLAYDDPTRAWVTLTSGLPGSGKSTWAKSQDITVLSLDAVREEFGGPGIAGWKEGVRAARGMAKKLLAAGEPFIWDSTNLTRLGRQGLTSLFNDYHARIRIVVFEAEASVVERRNRARNDVEKVPEVRMKDLISGWETPAATEAQEMVTLGS
jgi:predicted kinase